MEPNEINIVTNYRIIQEFKKYKNFTVSLGYSSTTKNGDNRVLNEKDKFAFFYNKRYNTTIYGQGCMGQKISVYTDHFIKGNQIAIYYDFEEFIFDFQWDVCREKGIEWYLGSLLKQIEEQLEKEKEKERERKSIKIEERQGGNPYKLVPGHPEYNPGSVTFEDVKAYKEAQRQGLIKV